MVWLAWGPRGLVGGRGDWILSRRVTRRVPLELTRLGFGAPRSVKAELGVTPPFPSLRPSHLLFSGTYLAPDLGTLTLEPVVKPVQ